MIKSEITKLKQVFIHPTFLFITILGNLFLLISVGILYLLEHEANPQIQSFWDALWWGVATITTVGYGDIVPATLWGKILGIILMFTGTVLFISFTGILVSQLMHTDVEIENKQLKEIKEELSELKKLIDQK